jgi:hypothetical protein
MIRKSVQRFSFAISAERARTSRLNKEFVQFERATEDGRLLAVPKRQAPQQQRTSVSQRNSARTALSRAKLQSSIAKRNDFQMLQYIYV